MRYSNFSDQIPNRFTPETAKTDPAERAADALEFIATALARIDANINSIRVAVSKGQK